MAHAARRLAFILCAALTLCAAGCFAGSSNPSYFPNWVPFGDVVRPHARPIGPSYYENYDPHAVDLALETTTTACQVGAQVVVLATVRDEKGVPRRQRMVEWNVNGGNLIQVDESGILNGRGGIQNNQAWSFTNYFEHRLSRGNANKADDIMLRPGQTWAVVSSPVEGDTHITAVVPGIYNWDKRMKTVVVRWVDAVWEFPPRVSAKFGTEHDFVTKIARHTDRQPLAKYRVRYKIIDGPPAVLLPSQTQEDIAVSDLNGHATMRIKQVAPASGVNRIAVEIIRPPDPTTPTGAGVPIVSGETAIEWLAPNVTLSHSGPQTAPLGQNVIYFTSAKNDGRMDSSSVEFTIPVPDGMDFVSSNPPLLSDARNGQLVFPFPALGVGQVHTVRTTFKSKRAGAVKCVALMRTAEGQTDQKEVNTLITTPQLKADIIAPKTGIINMPISYVIRLSNPGTGDLDDVLMVADYDLGLESAQHPNPGNDPNANRLTTKGRGLKAGESRDESLTLTPRRDGLLVLRVAVSAGGQEARAQWQVNVQKPNVSLRVLAGPNKSFVGRPADWKILVKNEGDVDQTGIIVRDRLPAELGFKLATRGGNYANSEVVWTLGTLKAGEQVELDLTTESLRMAPAAEKVTSLTADGGVNAQQVSRIQIDGIAALKMELTDLNDPVEIGKNVQYRMILTNTGSAPANKIDVKATVPELLKAVRADSTTQGTILGQIVTFGRVDNLQPGAKVTFLFECQALKAGKAYFKVEYTSELNDRPIYEEETTTIVAPFQNPLPAPPPPPAGGAVEPVPPGKN